MRMEHLSEISTYFGKFDGRFLIFYCFLGDKSKKTNLKISFFDKQTYSSLPRILRGYIYYVFIKRIPFRKDGLYRAVKSIDVHDKHIVLLLR